MAWDVQRVLLAHELGWTLDQVDALPSDDLAAVLGVLDGRTKALNDMSRRKV